MRYMGASPEVSNHESKTENFEKMDRFSQGISGPNPDRFYGDF
jgi:hypothetical protein